MYIFLIANNKDIKKETFDYMNRQYDKIVIQFNHTIHIDKISANYVFIRNNIQNDKLDDNSYVYIYDDNETIENYPVNYKPTIGFIALNHYLDNCPNNKIILVGFTQYDLQIVSEKHDLLYERNYINNLCDKNIISKII